MTDLKEQREVTITKSLGEERRNELIAFINARIAEFNGKTEDKTSGKHGIPLMIFDRQQDAHRFADEISKRLDFPREHIEVKARKEKIEFNRPDVIRQ